MWLLIAFIAVPLIEIGLFIQVGGWLTLWPTLAIVLGTGILGTWLVRQQGLRVLEELRGSLRDMRDPLSPLAHGAMILFAGALLLTPGFFTDAVGFLLMIPAVRRFVIAHVASRVSVTGFATSHSTRPGPAQDGVIDADYIDVTDDATGESDLRPGSAKKPSGWTEH
tara:strand:+ start:265 stop:765 length:501 start_codon:yes stop_codon:yes gene_type:complete